MMMVMMDTATCYVKLHGYGYILGQASNLPPDWYSAVVVNGVSAMNLTYDYTEGKQGQGIYTFNVDPGNCRVSDRRYFNTYNDDTASTRLISYLQALANGNNIESPLTHIQSHDNIQRQKTRLIVSRA